jgi:serine/threonine protein kinase
MISNDRHQNVRTLKETYTEKIYLVTDESSPKGEPDVLIEITAPSVTNAANTETWFKKEIQPLLTLRHPQLQQLKQLSRTDNILSITQSYVAGKNYQDLLKEGTTFSEVEAVRWLKQLLPTLSFLHQQTLTHGNLSPSSIILSQDNTLPILSNYGIINEIKSHVGLKLSEPSLLEQAKTFPIQLPTSEIGEDLYSLGLTTLLLLTGKSLNTLFDFQTHTWNWEQWKLISDGLEQILNRMLYQSGSVPFSNAEEILQALNTLNANPTFVPPIYSSPQPSFVSPAYVPPATPIAYYPQQSFSPTPNPQSRQPEPNKNWMIGLGSGILVSVIGLGVIAFQQGYLSFNKDTKPAIAETNISESSEAPIAETPTELTQVAATQVVQDWLQAKKNAFAPPYNRFVLDSTTTGALKADLLKPGGPIDWLANNNAHYQFGIQKIDGVDRFIANGNQAGIDVKVTEDRTLYVNGRVDRNETDFKTRAIHYSLERVDGIWKIADYRVLK